MLERLDGGGASATVQDSFPKAGQGSTRRVRRPSCISYKPHQPHLRLNGLERRVRREVTSEYIHRLARMLFVAHTDAVIDST